MGQCSDHDLLLFKIWYKYEYIVFQSREKIFYDTVMIGVFLKMCVMYRLLNFILWQVGLTRWSDESRAVTKRQGTEECAAMLFPCLLLD